MLVKDTVEAGQSRTRSLEQEMQEAGVFDTEWSLGDLINLDDASEGRGDSETTTRKKLPEWPEAEGTETLQEYLGQFKKAALNKKAVLKTTKDRLSKEEGTGHQLSALLGISFLVYGLASLCIISTV